MFRARLAANAFRWNFTRETPTHFALRQMAQIGKAKKKTREKVAKWYTVLHHYQVFFAVTAISCNFPQQFLSFSVPFRCLFFANKDFLFIQLLRLRRTKTQWQPPCRLAWDSFVQTKQFHLFFCQQFAPNFSLYNFILLRFPSKKKTWREMFFERTLRNHRSQSPILI